jgi:hypothetical protein
MLINEVKQLVEQLGSKSQTGGYLPGDEYTNYANLAQFRAIDALCQVIDRNQHVISLSSDFVKTVLCPVTNGRPLMPHDYYKFWAGSAMYVEGGAEVLSAADYVGYSEWAQRKTSTIIHPTTEFPIITEDSVGLLVSPLSIQQIKLTYAVFPTPPKWVADPDEEIPTFDPILSTDFILSSKFKDYLVKEIANMFGIEVLNQTLQQATLQNMIEGKYP